MSRQINFFADSQDSERVHSRILKQFPDLRFIPFGRKPEHELRMIPNPQAIDHFEAVFLVPRWAESKVVLIRLPDGYARVDERSSPVIEYKKCTYDKNEESLHVGRFYWAYEGSLPSEKLREIDSLFRWVRKESVSLSWDKHFRIFPHVARTAVTLDFRFGVKHPVTRVL